jgi:hypothetical protein
VGRAHDTHGVQAGGEARWMRNEHGRIQAYVKQGLNWSPVDWMPMEGSQRAFMECPITEVLYEGNRGGGKTDALLMSFCQHIGKWGKDWVGIIFRRTFPELDDIEAKSIKWFDKIFKDRAKYNRQDHTWKWDTGERLLLRHMMVPDDYRKYHGHSYPFIGFEELTTWPVPDCFVQMLSTCRSTVRDMPRMIRATTNPFGPGHNWVKARYKLPTAPGRMVGALIQNEPMKLNGRLIKDPSGKVVTQPDRVAIRSKLTENILLLDADPGYLSMIAASARNPQQLQAWIEGSWDIVSGGMFDDRWDHSTHVVPRFQVPPTWRMDRSFDWGTSSPFSVGFWAESNGEDLTLDTGETISTVRGDLFRVNEWYGTTGEPDKGLNMTAVEVARGVKSLERQLFGNLTIGAGPADGAIYSVTHTDATVAKDMEKEGVYWMRADKSSGSRVNGWQRMREMLRGATPPADGSPRTDPGLFVTDACQHFIRTVPVLSRSAKNPEDIEDGLEDHIADETRYRVYSRRAKIQHVKVRGR